MVASVVAFLTLGVPSTPADAIKQYVDAWNRRDVAAAEALLIGTDHAAKVGFPPDSTLSYRVTSVSVFQTAANVRINLVVHVMTTGQDVDIQDKVDLRLVGKGWKLLPVPADDPAGYVHVLQWFGSTAFEDTEQLSGDELDSSPADMSLWNARHVASAMLRYRAANGGRFMGAGTDVHKLLSSFLLNERFWVSPIADYAGTSINPRLLGLSASDIHDPDHTVLVYQGVGGIVNFPKHRTAAVAFASGRVQSVSAKQANSLNWAP